MLVVGVGALACLFAARLSAAGENITMLGSWPEALDSLRRHGVRLVEADGHQHAYPVQATDRTEDCAGSRYVLVLVKSWQTARAAHQLAACLEADGLALTLQNGFGNRLALEQVLGEERVALGVTTVGAYLVEPGLAQAAGEGIVSLGQHPRLAALADRLVTAGFNVQIVEDPSVLLWGKLVINAAVNPLTAILGMTNGELLAHDSSRALMAEAAREAAAVAAAQGFQLPYPDPVALVEAVAQRTGANRSSMLQDITRGAPTEIDAICGAIVHAGQQVGVPTPINYTLWQLVKALESKG